MHIKRLRIFAVSNGSGKSVLYKYLLSQHYFNKYFYINADDITKGLSNGFSFSNWPVEISEDSFYKYLETSSFNTILNSADLKKHYQLMTAFLCGMGRMKT